MEIEVKGHSGCSIDIVREGNTLYIDKGTKDPKYVERLYRQAQKQRDAQNLTLQYIRVPKIINISKSSDSMMMRMEYVYAKNFIVHFELAGFDQIQYFVKAMELLLETETNESPLTPVGRNVITDKMHSIKQIVMNNAMLSGDNEIAGLLATAEKVFNALPETLMLPVGRCHGDLTFSNILFNGNNYYLIDFLDSFIETPLMDMVKLRQDTAYGWSTLMYTGQYDKTRLHVISHKIDTLLDEAFSKHAYYKLYYKEFQLMNFLRILQYAKDENVVEYLKTAIKELV